MSIAKRPVRPSAAAKSASVASAKGKRVTKVNDTEETEDLPGVTGNAPFSEVGTAQSVTRRFASEDIFISVSVKLPCTPGDEAETFEKADAFVTEKLTAKLEELPDETELAAGEEAEDDEDEKPKAGKGKKAAKDEDEDEDTEDSEDEVLTEEMVMEMKPKELGEVIDEFDLEVDRDLKLGALRKAVWKALEEQEDAEGESEDGADEDAEDEDSEGSEDGEDGEDAEEDDDEPYTKDGLLAMKLEELQEIADVWELKVKIDKGASLKDKKAAYAKSILAAQG